MISSGSAVSEMREKLCRSLYQSTAPIRSGDAARDAAAQHAPSGVASQIGFDQGLGDAGQRCAFGGERQRGHESAQASI